MILKFTFYNFIKYINYYFFVRTDETYTSVTVHMHNYNVVGGELFLAVEGSLITVTWIMNGRKGPENRYSEVF